MSFPSKRQRRALAKNQGTTILFKTMLDRGFMFASDIRRKELADLGVCLSFVPDGLRHGYFVPAWVDDLWRALDRDEAWLIRPLASIAAQDPSAVDAALTVLKLGGKMKFAEYVLATLPCAPIALP